MGLFFLPNLKAEALTSLLFRITFSRMFVDKTVLEDRNVSLQKQGQICSLAIIIKIISPCREKFQKVFLYLLY